jgi:hypothetical protein
MNGTKRTFEMAKRYAVWGVDRSYRWLWLAALHEAIRAFKNRYTVGKQVTNEDIDHQLASMGTSEKRKFADWINDLVE